MAEILYAEFLSRDVKLFRVYAPKIAKKRKAGQFVIVRVADKGERIPLTIADSDAEEGSVTIIVQGIGKSTKLLNQLETGDEIQDIVGPLGKPSEVEKYGTAVVLGGGVGTAIAYPTASALRRAGNRVISIIGARTKDLVILEKQMRDISDELHISTDDGSYGYHGFVTEILKKLLEEDQEINFVLAIGPIPMMNAVAELTRPYEIKTVVSLNPIMVDGTGMCGGCRVTVGDDTKFACVDGPEFNAHMVDFQNLMRRNTTYLEQEEISLNRLKTDSVNSHSSGDKCKLEKEITNLKTEK
jgi:ferredoxin--NADP+ reductase